MFSRYSALSRYTPHADPYRIDICLHTEHNKGGVSHLKLPSEGYRAIGGYSSYSIAISRYTAPLRKLVVKFDGEICGGVLVENVFDDFPQQKKPENPLPNFAGSSPPISPKTSPTSLWKSPLLILLFCRADALFTKSCTATSDKLHCNCIDKAALQESGAFLLLSCGFQAPTFRLPCLGPAERWRDDPIALSRIAMWFATLFGCFS